ncbi:rhomboid-related protein 2 [Dendroctonus ponderosae]|uniref:rhomboid-related protein 2 n=1 Tax=Dendroctonus ponderosae TaxID=77166 RepID=UPI0020358BA6|nr:rhomboid-related protein 2 [Dendroctonus ponderosae]KAH1018113.1 hypothetical protein HUJ05_005929 [Dendroctonus ponderosae]
MPTSERTLSKYRSIFEQCDTDQNNLICLAELTAFLRSKGHTNDLSDEKVSYVFKLANRDGDKTLNFDEFVYMLEHPDLQHLFGHYMNNYVNFLIPQHKEKPVRVVPKGRSIRVGYAKTAATQVGLQRRISIESTEISLFVKEDEDIVYGDQYTCCPPPLAILLITLLELAFFIVDESTEDPAVGEIGKTAQVFMYEPSKRHEAWRFLTYMFVHIGYLHIIVNLVIQLVLGVPLEMVHKWWRVLLLYFAGVIAGSLATSITDPRVRLAGASGGVYCLLTAHIATIIMNWSEMTLPFVQLAIYLIVVFGDLGSSIYNRYYLETQDQVGYTAHLGGAVAGLLVGIYLLKNLNVKSCERYLWWAAVITYGVLMVTAIFLNVMLPHRYPARV